MPKGTVKWFNESKVFSFITPDDGGPDVFAHYSEIQVEGYKSIAEGDVVTFEVAESEKGPTGTNIVKQ